MATGKARKTAAGARKSRQEAADRSEKEQAGGMVNKTVRFDAEVIAQVQAMANAREMSFSAVVRAAAEMYMLREQFAVGLENVEANIGATLNAARKDTHRVADDVQLVIAYVDQLTTFLMMALPEVVDKEGAAALGNRRKAGFIAEFHKAFSSRRRKAAVSLELDSMGGEG